METTRFQIMSDLHLETPKTRPSYQEFTITPVCPNLVLLGDIGNVRHDELFEFLELQLHQFDCVFFLLGNHEPYGLRYDEAVERVKTFEIEMAKSSHRGEFIFLHRRIFHLGGIIVLGCTLHSEIISQQRQSISLFVTDFSEIEEWTIDAHNDAHRADLDWLDARVTQISQSQHDKNRPIVIFSHHSPTKEPQANDPQHAKDSSEVNSAFVTDLSNNICWTSPQVSLWAFGHTHFNCDFEDKTTGKRVVANQKGYRRQQNVSFQPDLVVEIPALLSRKSERRPAERTVRENSVSNNP